MPDLSAAKTDEGDKTKKELKRERADEQGGGKRPDREQRALAAADSPPMVKLREQMKVSDDTEWQLIFERIQKVTEVRRALLSNARPVAMSGAKGRGMTAIERDSLRQAVSDQLPDAEIKSRLARAREAQQKNEQALAQAEQDLRALLTVRQEAVAVLAGLLTP